MGEFASASAIRRQVKEIQRRPPVSMPDRWTTSRMQIELRKR